MTGRGGRRKECKSQPSVRQRGESERQNNGKTGEGQKDKEAQGHKRHKREREREREIINSLSVGEPKLTPSTFSNKTCLSEVLQPQNASCQTHSDH